MFALNHEYCSNDWGCLHGDIIYLNSAHAMMFNINAGPPIEMGFRRITSNITNNKIEFGYEFGATLNSSGSVGLYPNEQHHVIPRYIFTMD